MFSYSRRMLALFVVASAFLWSGFLTSCGIPDYHFLPDTSNTDVTRPTCTTSADCSKFSSTKVCDVTVGLCVECTNNGSGSGCGAGLYCNGNRCSVGCSADADCGAGFTCSLATHHCAGCSIDADCPTGTACVNAECVPKCTDDASCPSGLHCCGDTCADFGSDPLACSGCGKACLNTQECLNGQCGAAGGCPPNFADCDHKPENGCEASLLSVDNCGTCGVQCSKINGQAACADGSCSIVCDNGFSDCDGKSETGCEINTNQDSAHCGDCNTACTNDNGSTSCVNGSCTPVCGPGFGDCDGDPTNGCEADVSSSLDHCGACDTPCTFPNGTPSCTNGVCSGTCNDGFKDCDGKPENGCEADLGAVTSCGDCGVVCNDTGGKPSCDNGTCGITCTGSNADCANGADDGCEVDTAVNVKNCGGCGKACVVPPMGSVTCVKGECVQTQCTAPLADCNNDANLPNGDGCETNTNTSVANCGGCGMPCNLAHASAKCIQGQCVVDTCDAGFDDCTSAPGCETKLGTVTNCTKCGEACQSVNGGNACTASGCQPNCAAGSGDCDGMPDNGCETPLNSLNHCGSCPGTCAAAHATTSCATGVCQIVSCDSGYGDCVSGISDGCETRLNTLQNCGTCNVPCALPNASATCATGTCAIVGCNNGFADCSSSQAGCETALATSSNCSMCGDACLTTNTHVTQNICTGAAPNASCAPTCAPGFKSCNGNPSDGCETDITTTSNCGDCFVQCMLPHVAVQACGSGACQVGTCATGFADCNGSPIDGCERPVSADVTNCGNCNVTCSSKNGTPSCAGGNCSIACNAGFGDCDNDVSTGCEHDVTSDPANCGACGHSCGGGFCINSTCRAHLDISVVNSNTTGSVATTGANLTLSHTLQTAAGNHRAVLVGVAGIGNGTSNVPSQVTYNGQAMTLLQGLQSGNSAWAGIYMIGESALPTVVPKAYNIVITAASTSQTFGLIGNAIELKNVQQIAPIVDVVAGGAATNCNTSSRNDSISVSANGDGSLIYGMVGAFANSAPTTGATSSQIVTLQANIAGTERLTGLAGYVVPVAASSTTLMNWSISTCNSSAQALVAIKPVNTP